MPKYVVGVDVGGTKIAFGLLDGEKIIDKNKIPSDKTLSPEQFFDVIISEIEGLLCRNNIQLNQLRGVGIGMPSFIDFDKGHIILTSNLTKIKDFPAKEYVEKRLHVNVVLDNDCNTAAIAEHRYGAGTGYRHMLYCAVSTGIANGIIINNELFRGTYGWAGETGHMLITPDEGVECGCENRGCFMSQCSGSMIVKHILNKIQNGEKTIMTELAGSDDKIMAEHICKAAYQKDELALWAVEYMAKNLGIWLYNLYQTFNINCFVLGGGLIKFGDILFDRVREVFNQYNHNDYPVYFKFAQLGDDFGIIGAAALIQ